MESRMESPIPELAPDVKTLPSNRRPLPPGFTMWTAGHTPRGGGFDFFWGGREVTVWVGAFYLEGGGGLLPIGHPVDVAPRPPGHVLLLVRLRHRGAPVALERPRDAEPHHHLLHPQAERGARPIHCVPSPPPQRSGARLLARTFRSLGVGCRVQPCGAPQKYRPPPK